ncbi:hypothetical protein BJX68DRAFT_186176 [Aspergillus pseudodeflectus]|uniref:Uncharacterized protein n=1 Tax=Aspergillus pseudodeflectus TaxID=176178 RepID=A0ABR4JLH7_9EURO
MLPTCLHDGSEVPAGRGSGKGPQCLQDAFRFQKDLLREIREDVKGSEFQKRRPLVQCSGSGQDNGRPTGRALQVAVPSTPVPTADSIPVLQAFVESSVDPLQPPCSTRSSLWRPALGSLATCEHDRVSQTCEIASLAATEAKSARTTPGDDLFSFSVRLIFSEGGSRGWRGGEKGDKIPQFPSSRGPDKEGADTGCLFGGSQRERRWMHGINGIWLFAEQREYWTVPPAVCVGKSHCASLLY